MSRELWNEGRVVGYSAYEIYVKQHLAEDPNTPPATEREWLASSLAMGASMLVRIPDIVQSSEDKHTFHDIYLPTNSRLGAANTIVASFFEGEAAWNGNWATKVTDYGPLISNTSTSSPSATTTSSSQVPMQTLDEWTDAKKNKLKDYMKIVDGLIIQPGKWPANSSKPPEKDFQPDLTKPPTFRIHVKGSIKNKPYVLLTGFTIRSVLIGTTAADSAINTPSAKDGDFLGPGAFPWANKVVFSVPNSYISYFASGAYKRKLPPDSTSILVQDTPVIDMQSPAGAGSLNAPVLENYYNTELAADTKLYPNTTAAQALTKKRQSRVTDVVDAHSTFGEGTSVLTVYSKKAIYPPALYGTFVDATGTKYLHPLDIVAPGSIKMFYNDDGTTMKDYENTFPGTSAFNKTPNGKLEMLDNNGRKVQISGDPIDLTVINTPNYDPSLRDTQNAPYGITYNTPFTYGGSQGLGGKAVSEDELNVNLSLISSDGKYLNTTGRKSMSEYNPMLDEPGKAVIETLTDQQVTEESIISGKHKPYTYPQSTVWNVRNLTYGMLTWRDLLYALRDNRAISLEDVIKYHLFEYLVPGPGIDISFNSRGVGSITNTALIPANVRVENGDSLRFRYGANLPDVVEDKWGHVSRWAYHITTYNGYLQVDSDATSFLDYDPSSVAESNQIYIKYREHANWIYAGEANPDFRYSKIVPTISLAVSQTTQKVKLETSTHTRQIASDTDWTQTTSNGQLIAKNQTLYSPTYWPDGIDAPVTVEISVSGTCTSEVTPTRTAKLAHPRLNPEGTDASGKYTGARLGHADSLKYSNASDVTASESSGLKSRIFGIKFTGPYTYLNGVDVNKSTGVKRWTYSYRDTSADTGVWNIYCADKSSLGGSSKVASWTYNCGMGEPVLQDDIHYNKPRLVVHVNNVADGKNRQIGTDNLQAWYDSSNGVWKYEHFDQASLFSSWINLTVSGVFYSRDIKSDSI